MAKAWLVLLLSVLVMSSSGFSSAFAIEFRSIDGSGNNPLDSTLGKAGTPLLRHTSQAYDDNLSIPRGGFDPSSLPSARLVSNAVSDQLIDTEDPSGASDMLWLWGQFVDHDIDLTGGEDPAEPFDIIVPAGDPDFGGTPTIPLSRSLYDNVLGIRQQLNQITAFIDASNVYGSDSLRADELRTIDGTGKLKTSIGNLLPFNTGGFPNAPANTPNFFLAGDVRANEQVSLTAMHTLFVREHNRIADEIKTELNNGNAAITQARDDFLLDLTKSEGDFIYEAARCVVGAQIQHITYNEFLPILLGPGTLSPYPGTYDNTVHPQIDNEFSTAAYRVGHTMLSSFLQRIDENGIATPLPLQNAFFNPSILQAEGIDNILRGMAQEHAQRVDTLIVDDVRNFLFGPPGAGGFDLASLNIQRGRDHGLPSYNDIRTSLSLGAKATFLDVTGGDVSLANKISSAYSSDVNKIDLWVGGLAEPHVNGGMVGETFSKLLSDQFERLRDGDRFFYLEPSKLAQLNVFAPNLQNTHLSDIILRNTDIDSIQQNVFLSSHQNTAVGGTLIPIDKVSLLLTGVQSTTWILPLILSIIGVGLVLVRGKQL